MNLRNKKELAARTFNVGKNRIVFLDSGINEIKEAITKQDMRDLKNEGAIIIKNVGGRISGKTGSRRRKYGKIKMIVNTRKRDYVIITRKLRKYADEMFKSGKISREEFYKARTKIKNGDFKDKSQLKTYFEEIKNENNKKKKKGK